MIIAAVGRVRSGPEMELARDYAARAEAGGRALGLAPVEIVEVESRPPGDARKEAAALLKATPDRSRTLLLDERGENWSSRQLAEAIARWRDDGVPAVTFWIGGADGSAQTLKDQADQKLAFGRQTWPHRLVRAMICEQVYRAVMILSANPYHRD
ncbi:MAG: 23S rRNA (pseudouridine(1915)-N(3))-methyltransferase RlmH [Hyphomonadaceae bacterium]|nr:23S rRNA (pseudouridine(1915)-N(3))-methyltransferase RlmH [Hyphomonadaceae bacterium]